jgi:GTP-binding protein
MRRTVVIVGRPNVGKSTLFNRLVGRRTALVDDSPGVTRDRRQGDARLGDLSFELIDTAGLEEGRADSLAERMRRQTDQAISTADLILFLVDARAGVTPLDLHFADIVRRADRPVVLVANKCEGRQGDSGLFEAFSIGLGDPVAMSAEHGDGLGELRDRLVEHLASDAMEADGTTDLGDEQAPDDGELLRPLRLSVVGRPNVGKSTLINRLLGEERLLTGPEPGLTRDSIVVRWHIRGRPVELVDTAGLRKKARITERLEQLSAGDTLRSIDRADVVALVVDGAIGLDRQDLVIASRVLEEGRALVVVVSKWDVVEDRQACLGEIRRRLSESLPQAAGVSVVSLSAATGERLNTLMPAVLRAYDIWNRRVPTAALNRWLGDALGRHPPPSSAGRRPRLRYVTQAKARPPTFLLFGTRTETLPDSYVRFLENALRDAFDLPGTPIRIYLRRGENPYADREGKSASGSATRRRPTTGRKTSGSGMKARKKAVKKP